MMDFADIYGLFFKSGEVTEIRILGLFGNGPWGGYAKGTVSGYFNNTDKFSDCVKQIESLQQATGVYFTLNPVDPALLARANNRLIVPKTATTDNQIICHRWLLIDSDPIRPGGISATEGELETALEFSCRIADYLTEYGFPQPITANSGNGGHLLYLLSDLSNLPEVSELKNKALKALAATFNTVQTTVDEKVFNAARIVKLYGTYARKGDSTDDRPHRMSQIESIPKPLVSVTLEQLKWLSSQFKKETASNSLCTTKPSNNGNLGALDVESYLTHYGVEVIKNKNDRTGYIYGLRHCIFNPEHAGNEAAIIQKPDGMLTYQCFHSTCQGRTWTEARQIISGNDKLVSFCAGSNPVEKTNLIKAQGKGLIIPSSGSIKDITTDLRKTIALNQCRGKIGEKTGFKFLDTAIHGFLKPLFYVVGAYTSAGKTAFMVQLVCNALEINHDLRIAIFSTEMTRDSVLLRLISNRTETGSLSILEGRLGKYSQDKVDQALKYFDDTQLRIFDDLYSVSEIRNACHVIGPLDIVFVDFIQNLRAEGKIYDRMSVIPVELQKMAKEINACIIGLSQVSNEAVKNDSPLIGFKGAGEIAAACDLGIWLERDKKDGFILQGIIRKNRHGPLLRTRLNFSNNFTRILENEQ